MATLYKVDGIIKEVKPKNGKKFKYEELRKIVDGMVEIVGLPSGRAIVVNEEGKLIGLQYNTEASKVWNKEYPIEKYPNNNDQTIVGDALVVEEKEIE